MNPYLRVCLSSALSALVFGNLARAQAPTPPPQLPDTTIKLQVVLSRYEGDKKLNSFPYTLSLVPGKRGSIRAGAEVPVPTFTAGTSGDKPAASPYTMQQVGSQVDATVTPTPDGKFRLNLSVTDRSIGPNSPGGQARVPNVPSFRNMTSTSEAILGNGETIQFTASSDPASNETFKIDVTLTVGNK